jgi:hypothetical protein
MPLATRRRRNIARSLIVMSGLMIASGCFGGRGNVADPFSGNRREAPGRLQVEVQNLNFNDLTVFAIRQGQQIRLGSVTGKSDREFSIEWDLAMPVQFRIDIVGGRSCRIREISADPGSTVWVQVPANVGLTECRAGRR